MTKQELIKTAYGADWDLVNTFVDKFDAWCVDKHYSKIECPKTDRKDVDSEWIRKDDGEGMVDVFRWRPISLRGIEDNNGWNCIHDYPVPNDAPDEKVLLYFDNGSLKKFSETFEMFEYVTHWRLIEEYPPPLYRDKFTEMQLKEF